MFDASYLRPENATELYRNLLRMRERARTSQPSQMHRLLKRWADQGRLLRLYTQNIDGLERQAGMSVVSLGASSGCNTGAEGGGWRVPGETVVQLHGSFRSLRFRCTLCRRIFEKSDEFEDELNEILGRNERPRCDRCPFRSRGLPSRNATIGILRPDVLLFNEPSPHELEIQRIIDNDTEAHPDLLLIIGTRMDIVGVQRAVKSFAAAMRQDDDSSRAGESSPTPRVLLINRERFPMTPWKGVVDIAAWLDCGGFVECLSAKEVDEEDRADADPTKAPPEPEVVDTNGLDTEFDPGAGEENVVVDVNVSGHLMDAGGVNGGEQMSWEISLRMAREAQAWVEIAEAYSMLHGAGFNIY